MLRSIWPISSLARVSLLVVGAAAVSVVGCVTPPAEVSPSEIPELEARLADDPENGEVMLRYSAALFAVGRCDTATAVARRGVPLEPGSALGPLIIGQCLEQEEQYAEAITVYRRFIDAKPEARGVASVRARETIARRHRATRLARQALAREAELADQPAGSQSVAVLPLAIAGDSIYQPLSRGLAEIMTSDLALLRRFQLVERLELNALLDELELAQTERVDRGTAARLGRLVRAARMVQGLAAIRPEGQTRLEATIVLGTGEVTGPEIVTGRFRDLMRLEKDLVIAIAARLGYQLSEAERQLILENGTGSLSAFLAYSRGLVAEDLGDYSAAALYYSQAVQADPNFSQARVQHQAAVAAPGVQRASAVTTAAGTTVATPDASGNPLFTVIGDLAATQGERASTSVDDREAVTETTRQSGTTTTAQPPRTTTGTGTTDTVTGTVRIIFRIP